MTKGIAIQRALVFYTVVTLDVCDCMQVCDCVVIQQCYVPVEIKVCQLNGTKRNS